MSWGALLGALALGTVIGALRFTSPAVRRLTYRQGSGGGPTNPSGPNWYLGPSEWSREPGEGPLRSIVPAPVPSRAIAMWLGAGVVLMGLAVLAWTPAGAPGLAIVVGVFGVLLLGLAGEGWRQNRYLRGPRLSPLQEIVDHGMLRFSPRVDDLIREICSRGGRERLEREIDWGVAGTPALPPDELYVRLESIRNGLGSPLA